MNALFFAVCDELVGKVSTARLSLNILYIPLVMGCWGEAQSG